MDGRRGGEKGVTVARQTARLVRGGSSVWSNWSRWSRFVKPGVGRGRRPVNRAATGSVHTDTVAVRPPLSVNLTGIVRDR